MSSRILRMALASMAGACSMYAAGSISVSPASEGVGVGLTRQYAATVTGLASSMVSWSVNGVPGGNATFGTVDSMGLFTAPAAIPVSNPVSIQATSAMDPTVFGTGQALIKPLGPVLTSVLPASVPAGGISITLTGSGFQPGTSVVCGLTALKVTYISPTQVQASGTVTAQGAQTLYAFNPNSVSGNKITLIVTAPAGGGGGNGLVVSPAAATVVQGSTQQFTATYGYQATNPAWSVNGVPGGNATVGTISAAGLYTAPAVMPNPAVVTITAAGPNNSTSTASVTIASNVPPAITLVNPNPVPIGVFTLTVSGSGFNAASTASLGGTALAVQAATASTLTLAGYSNQPGTANLIVSNGPIKSLPFAVPVGVQNPLVSVSAARRFLEQAAFGPTPAEAAHLQQVGFQGWLNEQFAMAKTSSLIVPGSQGSFVPRFTTNAVMNPDQLRQKVAFALSQIFVTSINKIIWSSNMGPYQDMLLTDAFANYRQVLNDVTLHGAMGYFLDMANNGKANAAGTVLPNENYSREVLQLFSLGTSLLNPDGSVQVDASNNPIPTYDQTTVAEFARVFTGWTFYSNSPVWNTYFNTNGPMMPYPAQHDTQPKTVLMGVVLPANQTPQKDLADGLDNIFNHPNAGPFIGKQLIQHLVKSNPTPGYVQRVAAVFANNGQGVRGDLKAVVTAILLDSEARQNDEGGNDLAGDGHLQEPALFVTGFLRALSAQVNEQNYLAGDLTAMGQDLYNAPSVFNYYSPGYSIPQSGGFKGPEFQIYTPYNSIYRDNMISSLFSAYQNPIQTSGPGLTIDLTPYATLAANPSQLVDALDIALTHGTMPAQMKQILVTAAQGDTSGNVHRMQTAIYLILASSYYNVWH